MLKVVVLFSTTFLISFLGSIHPGPVNLSVIQAVLRKNFHAALWIGLGGALVEIPYGFVALQGVRLIERYPYWFNRLQLLMIPVMIGMGVVTLLRQAKTDVPEPEQKSVSFFKGVALSALNGQLPAYWFAILLTYSGYPLLRVGDRYDQIAFLAGAFLGAFLLQYTYARLTARYQHRILRHLRVEWMERLIGILFIGVGLWQGILYLLRNQ
ncbi:LysE family translocator [Siphonobacter aquaeclarae]|uniref:Threonine/homoserine/homoserine lactone efflux protein n=1 Tax=Siphonobacter aquaeclarae TaxID=563176 RepID=A0A1G9QFM7_9BACT|nr:LysE family transporter [Siphonobacter aquaeclarae]SDM09561.1 Threonine/homoserine/homoserine lactone efflux protein [Siphonobacter aquaeclarae]